VPERNQWAGLMVGLTTELAAHFPKVCSNEQCKLGGHIKLLPHAPPLEGSSGMHDCHAVLCMCDLTAVVGVCAEDNDADY
jgi:hypothetical protein